jgi:uncharacterized protein YndB with AHSA1/START domain
MNRHGTARVELPSDREIVITRSFDAPARLVFDVWTTPEHVRRWWSSETAPVVVCDIDLRVGGRWRYVTRDDQGVELGWTGRYREIVPGARIVATEVFEGYPDAEAVNTLVLHEERGVTTLTVTVLHATKENRDGHVASGMEPGMQEALNRLEDRLAGALDRPAPTPEHAA